MGRLGEAVRIFKEITLCIVHRKLNVRNFGFTTAIFFVLSTAWISPNDLARHWTGDADPRFLSCRDSSLWSVCRGLDKDMGCKRRSGRVEEGQTKPEAPDK